MHRLIPNALLSFSLLILAAGAASAAPFSFECITNNSATDCGIAETQLSGDLTGDTLTITMTGMRSAVVEQVFLEAAGMTGGSFLGGIGSDFGDVAPGGNLPGGNTVSFSSNFNFAADNPAPRHGVGYHNQDQQVTQTAIFRLLGDLSDIRIGVHVIGFRSGGSESLVSSAPVPEPSAALLFALGSLVVGQSVRRGA